MESHGGWRKAALHFLRQLSLEAAAGGYDELAHAYYYARSMKACSFASNAGTHMSWALA